MKQSISVGSTRFWTRLNYIYLLSVLMGISVILSTAMFLQYAYFELPCPMCLLQRVAYFGISFGIIMSFRNGDSIRYSGLSMLFTIFLLIVAMRQSLVDIVPRPNHQWIGSAILGLHMPIWSIIISLVLLIGYALKFSIIKHGNFLKIAMMEHHPQLTRIANLITWYLIVLCAMNVVSVIVQCGFDTCHTFYYRFLH